MEEPKKKTFSKQEKRKMMAINIGGGGVLFGGFVLLGGALATATLVSAFAFNRRSKRRSTSDHQPPPSTPINLYLTPDKLKLKEEEEEKNKDEVRKGLSSLLPDSSQPIEHHHPSSDGTANVGVTQIGSISSLASTQIMILDEKPMLELHGGEVDRTGDDEEILFSDISKKTESSPLCDDSGITTEEFSFPVLLKPENMEKNKSKEENDVPKEDEAIEAAHVDQIIVEDIPERQLNIEVEEECDNEAKVIVEKHEELFEAVQVAVEMELHDEQETPTGGDQEIVCCDSSIPSSSAFENYGVNKQEFSLPVFDNLLLLKPENVKRDEAIEAAHANQIVGQYPEKSEEVFEAAHHAVEMQLNEELENPVGDKEIICSGSLIPASSAFENYVVNKKESSVPAFSSPSLFKLENGNNTDSPERSLSIEDVQVMKGDEAIETAHGDQITIQLTEEEHDEDDGVVVEEKCEAAEDDQHIQLSKYQQILTNGNQEHFLSDTAIPSSSFGNDLVIVEEFSFPVLDYSSLSKPDNANKNNSSAAPMLFSEAVKVMRDVEAIELAHANQIGVEDNPPNQFTEKEQKEDGDKGEDTVAKGEETVDTIQADMIAVDEKLLVQLSEEYNDEDGVDDEEDITEKVEESSEGAGDSSVESNAEAIWPAESMQELSLEFKEMKINNQKLGENIEAARGVKTEDDGCQKRVDNGKIEEDEGGLTMTFSQRYMTELATQSDQPTILSKVRIWIWSMLAPLWCLCYWYFGLPFLKLCLIIVLIVILFKFHEV